MDNADIARVFEEIATLLEIDDGNPFRIQAYRNAAMTVADHPRPMVEMVTAGDDLTSLDFVGKDLAAAIAELVTTGRLQVLDEIGEKVPRTLLEMLRVPGLGPKKARKLWVELGATDLATLEEALAGGRAEQIPGFGKKTVENLQRRIQRLRERDAGESGAP